jgi:hypothetical protein
VLFHDLELTLETAGLVLGDVVVLGSGDRVPADPDVGPRRAGSGRRRDRRSGPHDPVAPKRDPRDGRPE